MPVPVEMKPHYLLETYSACILNIAKVKDGKQPYSVKVKEQRVVVSGETVGVAVLAFMILTGGVQLKLPIPDACNTKLSFTQINVSRKARLIGGLSIIVRVFEMVSRHPLVSVAINLTFFVPKKG